MFDEITEASNTFMNNHNSRMAELNQALASLNTQTNVTSENEAKLDASLKELEDLLNSF